MKPSKEFFFGIAILFGCAVGFTIKTGLIQKLWHPKLVSAANDTQAFPTAEDPDKPEGALDSSTPIYIVETEEDNNIKCASGHYADNKRVGLWEFYYQNGTTRAKGEFANDKKTGQWKNYYVGGQVMSEGRYENGVMFGGWISYFPNGNKKLEGSYDNGKQVGYWVEYFENSPDTYWAGNFNLAGHFDGVWKYFEGGKMVKTIEYNDGKVVK